MTVTELNNAIHEAVLAERKRCAKIADGYYQDYAKAAKFHPESSEARDRCLARTRAAADIERDILAGLNP